MWGFRRAYSLSPEEQDAWLIVTFLLGFGVGLLVCALLF